jgi:hypothetical protein
MVSGWDNRSTCRTPRLRPEELDVVPDGQHFLVAESTRPAEVNVVTNWVEELKAKVPLKERRRRSEDDRPPDSVLC